MRQEVFISTLLLSFFLSQSVIAPTIYPSEKLNGISASSNSTVKFHGWANSDFYIVGVSSLYKIHIDDFSYSIWGSISGKSYTYSIGGAIMNDTTILYGGPSCIRTAKKGIEYLHFKIGRVNYTYDNRVLSNWSSPYFTNASLGWGRFKDIILPPGKWYFIVFACWEDDFLQKDIKTNVWINFSKNCKELKISSSTDGKIHTWWYGEFGSNFIFYHFPFLSAMIGGKINFHINNTLIYFFTPYPDSKGIMRIEWECPNGKIDKYLILNLHGITIGKDKLYGVGEAGNYELSVSYWDKMSFKWRNVVINERWIAANPIGVIVIDAKLPNLIA